MADAPEGGSPPATHFGIGDLKPVSKPIISREVEWDATAKTLKRDATIKRFTSDVYKNSKNFPALCLKAWVDEEVENGPQNLWGLLSVFDGEKKSIMRVVAWSPELDPATPQPNGPDDELGIALCVRSGREYVSEFEVGAGTSLDLPAFGTPIKVGFMDPANRRGPVYLGKLGQGPMLEQLQVMGSQNAIEAFGGGAPFSGPARMPDVFFPGTTLGARIKPGKQYLRRKKGTTRPGEQSGGRRRGSPKVMLIHESAAGWRAYDAGRARDGGRGITHHALESKNLGVHFTVDRQGGIQQHGNPANWRYDHACGYNTRSVAIEVLNPSRTKKPLKEVDGGNFHAIGLGGWYRGFKLILATAAQMEAVWKLINNLVSSISTLKIGFMALKGNTFTYGNLPNDPGTATGVIAHGHVSSHSDGAHVELYCLLRAKGISPKKSYSFVMNALINAGKAGRPLKKINIAGAASGGDVAPAGAPEPSSAQPEHPEMSMEVTKAVGDQPDYNPKPKPEVTVETAS